MKPTLYGIEFYTFSKARPETYVVTEKILQDIVRTYSKPVSLLYYIQFTPYAQTHCYVRHEAFYTHMQKIFTKQISNEITISY